MDTQRECICCNEILKIRSKIKENENIKCITQHPGFEGVCLNPWVLETAYYSYRQQYSGAAIEGALPE